MDIYAFYPNMGIAWFYQKKIDLRARKDGTMVFKE
jgi:hypothetical protein